MVSKEELKWENDMWCFDNIKKFALASLYKRKDKNEKQVFITLKKSFIHEVAWNYC